MRPPPPHLLLILAFALAAAGGWVPGERVLVLQAGAACRLVQLRLAAGLDRCTTATSGRQGRSAALPQTQGCCLPPSLGRGRRRAGGAATPQAAVAAGSPATLQGWSPSGCPGPPAHPACPVCAPGSHRPPPPHLPPWPAGGLGRVLSAQTPQTTWDPGGGAGGSVRTFLLPPAPAPASSCALLLASLVFSWAASCAFSVAACCASLLLPPPQARPGSCLDCPVSREEAGRRGREAAALLPRAAARVPRTPSMELLSPSWKARGVNPPPGRACRQGGPVRPGAPPGASDTLGGRGCQARSAGGAPAAGPRPAAVRRSTPSYGVTPRPREPLFRAPGV